MGSTSVVSTGDMRDRSAPPKDDSARTLALQNGWASLLIQANMGGLRGALKVCLWHLHFEMAGLQGSFLQKKMQQPEAAFWEEKLCLDLSVCEAGKRS